ncbi:glycoside hydrolase family 66 protein [Kineothrix sp. MB12-C1]|uniref:glycoside hydrolase family 66 protein n=1 Tax=Kineothrix sp. MB12-C1 TaxID=3070215 RepID=UPI0027D20A3E|nr:glycoside hydrolase family 66 protein [Kineothrix sp. MB12-C1]WMC93683.1 glycoside hydrolase family 66 protein [Kineothrix sp. MB12-C1]
MKVDLYPEKAQYLTGEPIKLIVEVEGNLVEPLLGTLSISHLQEAVRTEKFMIQDTIENVTIEGFDTEFSGYGVQLLISIGEKVESYYTAFDVVRDSSMSIRYGFLSDFATKDGRSNKDVRNLRKYHINMVQYYDWSYRHDDLVSESTCYEDMMGKEIDLSVIKGKIQECKKYGMKSIGYGAIYAAAKEFYEDNKELALYTSAGEPLVFIDTFYIMNVSRKSRWHSHIIEEYCKAVEGVGFDGIHMDTYGFPKTAFSFGNEELLRLDQLFPELIEDTKLALNKITLDNHLIFNNVGNWPVDTVANSPQDAIYIEVWEPYVGYHHIKEIISRAKRACSGRKPIILAAYLAPFRLDKEERAAVSAYLLMATIITNGAYHLLLGEENGVLTQGYYVDHSFIGEETAEKLRNYYDFMIQYMNLFYDNSLIDVSMTHIGWDNTEYRCMGEEWSVDAQPGKIWITIKENSDRKLISFINLCSCTENNWNLGKEEPVEKLNIRMRVQIDSNPQGVYFISPDVDHGEVKELDYRIIKTDRGNVLECEVPSLLLWSNIWIDF